jgi:Colicin V production protein
MTIWILAFVLLASTAGLGLRQGVIRAAFSFVGIVAAALFAGPLGKLLRPQFQHVGIGNPVLTWLIAPFAVFVIILILFKVAGFFVQRYVDLFYKYKAGDLRRRLWERLNLRLGLCVGLLNGTAYLILVSFVIYNLSYVTAQVAPSDNETRTIKFINRLGRDLETIGLAKTARSVFVMPDMYYKLADLAGLLRQNPQLSDRLATYPAFLSWSERDDFKQLGQDGDFQNSWKNLSPINQLMDNSQFKTMLNNNDLTTMIFNIVQGDWDDLNGYLKTGKSPKYDSEKILGRWDFNASVTITTLRQTQPNIQPNAMRAARTWMTQAYADTTFVAGADKQAFLKNLPHLKIQPNQLPTTEKGTWQGQWKDDGIDYDLSLSNNGQSKLMTVRTDGKRLTIKSGKDPVLVFDHEE